MLSLSIDQTTVICAVDRLLKGPGKPFFLHFFVSKVKKRGPWLKVIWNSFVIQILFKNQSTTNLIHTFDLFDAAKCKKSNSIIFPFFRKFELDQIYDCTRLSFATIFSRTLRLLINLKVCFLLMINFYCFPLKVGIIIFIRHSIKRYNHRAEFARLLIKLAKLLIFNFYLLYSN